MQSGRAGAGAGVLPVPAAGAGQGSGGFSSVLRSPDPPGVPRSSWLGLVRLLGRDAADCVACKRSSLTVLRLEVRHQGASGSGSREGVPPGADSLLLPPSSH